MSVLLKTIEAFPRGRTTSELAALLDVAFDSRRKDAFRRELAELQASGVILLGRDNRWRAIRREAVAQRPAGLFPMQGMSTSHRELLIASTASFHMAPVEAEKQDAGREPTAAPDPHRAAVRPTV